MFTHYLITRFNIRITSAGPERMDSPEMDLDWLNYRLQIFLGYCAPSVVNQSCKNFTWLIYLDVATPTSILDGIAYLKEQLTVNFIFVGDYPAMMDDIIKTIRSVPHPYVITSRLDNDDIISTHYIRDVQSLFKPIHHVMINFTAGFEYSLIDGVLRKWNLRFNNQFSSLIENKDSDQILSIYGFAHWKIPVTAKMINVPGESHWMYLRHNLNYSGSVYTGIPIFLRLQQLDMFPEPVRVIRISFINTLKYAAGWFPKVIKRRSKNSVNKLLKMTGMNKAI